MSNSINDLLRKYAILGWEHWRRESDEVKSQARQIGVEIAADKGAIEYAATNPYRPAAKIRQSLKLVPMPCKPRDVSAAFFVPWVEGADSTELSFDLVILIDQDSPRSIAFRFESAPKDSKSTHGYNHLQLSSSLGKGQVNIRNVLSPLPTSYPAFPVPTKDPTRRFLAMAVAIHGYPCGFPDILRDIFAGEPTKKMKYLAMTKSMLGE